MPLHHHPPVIFFALHFRPNIDAIGDTTCEYLLKQIVCMHVLAEPAKMRLVVVGLENSEQTFGTLILEAISLDIGFLLCYRLSVFPACNIADTDRHPGIA